MTKENITQPEKQETITLNKEAFESLQRDLETVKKNNEMLLKIADKKALARFYQKHQQKLPLLVNLRIMNGKIIVGWDKMPANDVRKISQNKWIEDQRVKVLYEDGTKDEMSYLQFKDGYNLIQCKRMGVIQRGNMTALELIRLDNGEKYTVDVRFVN